MQHFLAGFFSALPLLGLVLFVRFLKDGFRSGVVSENTFVE